MEWRSGPRTSFEIAGVDPPLELGLWINPEEILVTRPILFNQAVMIRRASLAAVGGFDPRLRVLEDFDLSLKLSRLGPWAFLREPLVIWRESNGGCHEEAKEDGSGAYKAHSVVLREHQRRRGEGATDGPGLDRILQREVGRIDRLLKADALKRSPNPLVAGMGSLLWRLERTYRAVFVRSAKFPSMKTRPIAFHQT
jgi:hypothetical protein